MTVAVNACADAMISLKPPLSLRTTQPVVSSLILAVGGKYHHVVNVSTKRKEVSLPPLT
jgi:hypothetical protein